jgi:hypothetical protein
MAQRDALRGLSVLQDCEFASAAGRTFRGLDTSVGYLKRSEDSYRLLHLLQPVF